MNKITDLIQKYPFIIFLSFIGCALLLYSQIISAPPIWDDNYFIFDYTPFKSGLGYIDIWKNFGWPLSSSIFKATFSLFGYNYTLYHLTNILIHSLNSFLVYMMIRRLDLPFALSTSFLFLIHPANLMSVAWMIQIKTLVAFLFYALALHFYTSYGKSNKKFQLIFFVIFFALSILTKSTAIFLPVVLFFIHLCFKKINKKTLVGLIIFLSVSLVGGIKLMNNPNVTNINAVTETELTDAAIGRTTFAIQTVWYYLEQAFLPSSFVPVKGIIPLESPLTIVALALFLIALFILLFLIDIKLGMALTSALILMIPFLGIVKAPYMKITSVSDQHLYVLLPLLIWVFSSVISLVISLFTGRDEHKLKSIQAIILAFFISYLSSSTYLHSTVFKNEENFYQQSLSYNPKILSFYINLTSYYQEHNNLEAAVETINRALEVCQEYPELKGTEMHAHIGAKWFEVEQIVRMRKALEKN